MRQQPEHDGWQTGPDHRHLSNHGLHLRQKLRQLESANAAQRGNPMKCNHTLSLTRPLSDQNGQVLPWMAFLMCLFIGAAGITVDLGHAYVCYRELQASTDAAALAAGYQLSQSTATVAAVKAAASNYASISNGANVNSNLPNPTISTDLNCSSSVTNLGILCSSSPTGYNVVRVTQSVTVPTYFMKAFAI